MASIIKSSFSNLTESSEVTAISLWVVFIMVSSNYSLFHGITNIYPLTIHNIPFLVSISLFFTFLTAIFFLFVCLGRYARWILAFFLIVSSQAAYYMDHLGVIIDTVMIDNIIQTDRNEISGLITSSLIVRTFIFGLIPAWLVIKYFPKNTNFKNELISRLKSIGFLILGIVALVIPFTADYATFIREHKIVRFYANPTYATYSSIKFLTSKLSVKANNGPLINVAGDAKNLDLADSKKELIIMVVGETARADRFSLNGYKRDTNPRLSKEDVVSFSNVSSCGTSTSVSVPCMFSSLGRENYDKEKALAQENLLDVLNHHGIAVLWRDNNSDSKGVATRIRYEDFKSPTLNPVCHGECRDIGMLNKLDEYINQNKGKDIFIVLHQMGNHGPEYYRRYPKEFEKFKPACQTGELRDCTQQEIDNAYDNAILYTDYFLSEVISFLKKHNDGFETAMLYVADHGESLGEHGFYLHAAPYMLAPKEQKHVPAILWTGSNFDYNIDDIKPFKNQALSHDDLFCSIMIAYELESGMCAGKNNMLTKNKNLKNYAISDESNSIRID
jgi:lipid A ethanolaminephosphotransferase